MSPTPFIHSESRGVPADNRGRQRFADDSASTPAFDEPSRVAEGTLLSGTLAVKYGVVMQSAFEKGIHVCGSDDSVFLVLHQSRGYS